MADYSSNTILVPKIQEIPSEILFKCRLEFFSSNNNIINFNQYNFKCQNSIIDEIDQELLKRFYKPIYIPIIAIICCFLIIVPKNNISYKKNRKITFLVTFLIIILSEASLRYSTISSLTTLFYLIIPFLIFSISYLIFYYRSRNV